jgi:hypothetical protein
VRLPAFLFWVASSGSRSVLGRQGQSVDFWHSLFRPFKGGGAHTKISGAVLLVVRAPQPFHYVTVADHFLARKDFGHGHDTCVSPARGTHGEMKSRLWNYVVAAFDVAKVLPSQRDTIEGEKLITRFEALTCRIVLRTNRSYKAFGVPNGLDLPSIIHAIRPHGRNKRVCESLRKATAAATSNNASTSDFASLFCARALSNLWSKGSPRMEGS